MTRRCLVLTALVVGLSLGACLKQGQAPINVATSGTTSSAFVVARSFSQLNSQLHLELRASSSSEVTVGSLRASRDTHLFTEERVRWGPEQQFRVLQFTDTNRPTSSDPPTAAWFLGPEPVDGAADVVAAILYRNFDAAPQARDPESLLVALAGSFPSPWKLCQPTAADYLDLVIAYDPSRGIKLAMFQYPDEPRNWSVDHVEFISSPVSVENWWKEKGYGSCVNRVVEAAEDGG